MQANVIDARTIRTGACLCGNLRLRAEGQPRLIGKCYCEDCRRESGAGHTTWLVYPAAAVALHGESRSFSKQGGSGETITRTFCPNCGSTLFGEPKAYGDGRAVRAGVLDDPSDIKPALAVFVSRACGWDRPPDDMPTFPEGLPLPPMSAEDGTAPSVPAA